MYNDDASIKTVTTVLPVGKLMSSKVLIVKYASQSSWEVMDLVGRPSGHGRHVLGCTVDHSLVLALPLFSGGPAGSFITYPCLFRDPQTKDLQMALVFFNHNPLMTRGNSRKK